MQRCTTSGKCGASEIGENSMGGSHDTEQGERRQRNPYDHPSTFEKVSARSQATKEDFYTSVADACNIIVTDVCTCSGRNPSPIIRAGIRRRNGSHASRRIGNGGGPLSPSVRARLMTRS